MLHGPKAEAVFTRGGKTGRPGSCVHTGEKPGPNLGQVDAYAFVEAVYPDAQFFVNVDDDVIYNPHWFSKLLEAQKELQAFGLNGIFTALNMPWRKPFAELHTQANTYLLKWKPPALNWLIPRRVYDRVGPFVDDGIAYDTSYSQWLQLHGVSDNLS